MPYEILGPYKYEDGLPSCFWVSAAGVIIACFYAVDGDEKAARARANLYVEAAVCD